MRYKYFFLNNWSGYIIEFDFQVGLKRVILCRILLLDDQGTFVSLPAPNILNGLTVEVIEKDRPEGIYSY